MRRRMRPASLLFPAALALWAPAAAADDFMASAVVEASSYGYHGCYLTNLGPRAVRVRSVEIVAVSRPTPIIFNNCPASLRPGKSCVIRNASDISMRRAFCRATVGNKAVMRGRAEARTADHDTREAEPLE